MGSDTQLFKDHGWSCPNFLTTFSYKENDIFSSFNTTCVTDRQTDRYYATSLTWHRVGKNRIQVHYHKQSKASEPRGQRGRSPRNADTAGMKVFCSSPHCLFVCLPVCLSVSSAFWRIRVFIICPSLSDGHKQFCISGLQEGSPEEPKMHQNSWWPGIRPTGGDYSARAPSPRNQTQPFGLRVRLAPAMLISFQRQCKQWRF